MKITTTTKVFTVDDEYMLMIANHRPTDNPLLTFPKPKGGYLFININHIVTIETE